MIITASLSETRRLWTIWHIWLWSKWEEGKGEESIVCVEGEHVGEMIFMLTPLQTGINESHN